MKRSTHLTFFVTLLLVFSMLMPTATLGFGDDKKYFKEGMKFEASEEWDKAVEQFALAVADSPKNPEYRLHLVRALFNASQMYMKKGSIAANEKDYLAGYAAFRRAYAFDPTNELAKTEMDRMVRLQKALTDPDVDPKTGNVKLVPTAYTDPKGQPQMPQKLERLRDVSFPTGIDLQAIIKELAKDLDLNVLFDRESFQAAGRKTTIDLKSVTPARALDYIFLQEGLFFQKVGPRTIMVATQAQRVKFQQLVLRTFYLANAAPKDVAKVVQTAIPAQPGRSGTIVLTDDATNSVTIRDTQENIQLIGSLIASLDKDRAEVVMDVAIYEVNKTDLLQIGNQIGNQSQLTNLGGSQQGQVGIGPKGLAATAVGAATAAALPYSIATGIILPSMTLSAFQSKSDTKLIASTQIHAFNNEDSSARIGQRVPVQSAQFVTGTGTTTGNGGVVSNVINYEQVGLTLKFKPLVFPNQDVQVAMEIESKDVAGASTLTPTFTERTIKGTARIQNNKTLLLASVAQGTETKGRQGLPLLGLIPLLGRLFTAPTRDNRQVDIVIAVTPRVIRAPAILPEDEIERPTGSLAVPTNSSLEAMIVEEDRQDYLAAMRRLPTNTAVQLPDREAETPDYVKTDAATTGSAKTAASDGPNLKPIDNSVKTLQLNQTSDTSAQTTTAKTVQDPVTTEPTSTIAPVFGIELPEMKAGERLKIPVVIDGTGSFRTAVMGLKFDAKKVVVRSVSYGDVFGVAANSPATPFLNQNGKMYVSLTAKEDANATGTFAYIEIEALVSGRPDITFDRDVLNFMTADGKSFRVKFD
ncbi:MAG: secretin N-terminal domain-containing protein [Pyrinomonadaceae bacterium]